MRSGKRTWRRERSRDERYKRLWYRGACPDVSLSNRIAKITVKVYYVSFMSLWQANSKDHLRRSEGFVSRFCMFWFMAGWPCSFGVCGEVGQHRGSTRQRE